MAFFHVHAIRSHFCKPKVHRVKYQHKERSTPFNSMSINAIFHFFFVWKTFRRKSSRLEAKKPYNFDIKSNKGTSYLKNY